MGIKIKIVVFFLIVFFFSTLVYGISYAQDSTSTPSATQASDTSKETQDLQNKINELQGKVKDLQGQERTLASQIAVMDNQAKLTELRISSTKQQIVAISGDIQTANKKIETLEKSLENLTKILVNRVVATYEVGSIPSLSILLSSDNASDFLSRLSYLKIAQESDKRLVFATQQAKNDYVTQKNIFEDKKKKVEALKGQLEAYTRQLESEKQSRVRLLAETQGSEANYRRLLSQAQAQLSALASFASSRFGTSLVSHQDLSDGFGKYYNQRDSSWGNFLVNNDTTDCRGGPCTIARIGCLLTSYAMVVSHFGGSLTPPEVAANSSNFSANTADFNKPGSSANGHSAGAVNNPSLQEIRDALNSGAVVVAGLSANGGPYPTHYSDHWVVLRSVDGDSFRINDPAYENGMNVSLRDHYSGWAIIESRIYR